MSVTIEIDAPQLLPHLLAGLEAGGCSAELISSHSCRVIHPQGVDEGVELLELRFYVRAWARRHGNVAVTLSPDA
ncbi:MAG: hypothetical protein ACJ77E_19185 [Gaiellaceae bacterium]